MWDIFSTSKLIRFIAVDKSAHRLNGWNTEDQNLNSFTNIFMNLGSPRTGLKVDLDKGLKAAVDALSEPTEVQRTKRSTLTEDAAKVLNKGRVILVTQIECETEVVSIKEKFHDFIIQGNKVAAATDNLMPVNHCDLVILNYIKESSPAVMDNKVWHESSTLLSCELFNIHCGVSLAPKLCSLVLKHYKLASTTVTGIPMKEEQNANSSANYDVELFHPSIAHTAILKGIPSETAHLKTVREGTNYETVTLKWCTPRSSASLELQHCSSAYRITSVDVNSRPSSCLTNFLLNGRWVMLEMPRKSGSKVISHMLASHGGDIYIHTLYTSRSVLEDPPSVSECVGGRVTDYRIPDFSDVIRLNMLAPHPEVVLEEGEEGVLPLESSIELLKRHTKIWPITLASSFLFSLGHVVAPLRNIYIKDQLTEDEVVECKNVVFALMNMETRGENLLSSSSFKGKAALKKEEQYKVLWKELDDFLKAHLYSPNHKEVIDCLADCQSKENSGSDAKKDEKANYSQISLESDQISSKISAEKKTSKSGVSSKTPNEFTPARKKQRTESNLSKTATSSIGKRNPLSFYTLLENKFNSDHAKRRCEFKGRLKAENGIAKLYPNLQKEKDIEETSRRK